MDDIFSSALEYMSQPHAEVMAMRPDVSYIPYAISLGQKTGDIITFAQFEYGKLLSENHDNTEISNKSDEYSTLPPLISEE